MTTEPLGVLVGRWASSGRTVARPGEPSVEIEGTDVYEWGPGRHVLVHHVDVRMGGEQVDVLEVIGPADATGGYPMRAYDQVGGVGTMHATVDAGVWTFAGETERATLTVTPDGSSMDAVWERSADGGNSWEPWMDMHFRRAEPVPTPREVAVSFIEAFGRGDRAALASLLADDVTFESPQVRLTGATAVVEAISRFADLVTGVTIHAVLGNEEQAMITYDMATKPFGTLRAVDHLVVRDGRIVSDVLVFDTYEVRRATEAQASPVDART